MKVYGHPLSSCTRKVMMTLAEKGRDADFVTVDLFTGEHKGAGHLVRHPFGVVPVLDDDGFVLFESRAIVRYLEAKLGGARLVPDAPRSVARMDQWMSVDQSYVAPHTRALAIERIVKKHQGADADATAIDASERALAHAFATIDDALAKNTWLAGDAFSLADISLAPYVASLPMIGAQRLLSGLPYLSAWWSRVRERPSWQRVLALA
jgi:glutathione S-transferase